MVYCTFRHLIARLDALLYGPTNQLIQGLECWSVNWPFLKDGNADRVSRRLRKGHPRCPLCLSLLGTALILKPGQRWLHAISKSINLRKHSQNWHAGHGPRSSLFLKSLRTTLFGLWNTHISILAQFIKRLVHFLGLLKQLHYQGSHHNASMRQCFIKMQKCYA